MKQLPRLVAAIFFLAVAQIPPSAAQNVNVMNLFGGLMRAAVIEQAKAQWRKINAPELACIEEQLQQRGLSSSSLSERGIFPTDGSIAGIRAGCMRAAMSPAAGPAMKPATTPQIPQLLSAMPTFDCSKAKSTTARIICDDPGGAKADWDLTSAYWALLFSLSLSEQDKFKLYHEDWPQSLNRICRLRPDQSSYSQQQRQCVLTAFHKQANAYRSRLRGDALAESLMEPPEKHAQLQSTLIALGYLEGEPDGEFGPLTRDAIKRFQMQSGEAVAVFLNSVQRARLNNDAVPDDRDGSFTSAGSPSPPALGRTATEIESQCQSDDTNKRLAGCAEIIGSKGKGYGVALADAYDGRCRSYNDLGRYQQAADDCKAAIKLKSNHAYAYNNLAAALDGLGDLRGAISAFSTAIALKPAFVYSYLGRAFVFIKLGDKDRAKTDFMKALAIDSSNQTAKDGIASLRIETPALTSAKQYLDDVQAFVAAQTPAPRSISQIATSAAALQGAITGFDENEARQMKAQLDDLLDQISGFKVFLKGRQDERDQVGARRLARSVAQATDQLCVIDNYIKTHLLDARNSSLLKLRERVASTLSSPNDDQLGTASQALETFVQDNGLSPDYDSLLQSCTKTTGPVIAFPRNEKTEIVLDGPEDDIVLLFNATPSAPSIFKDLDGKFVLLAGAASMCFAQTRMDEDLSWFIERRLSSETSSSLVRYTLSQCEFSQVRSTVDIIVFQRGELLKQDQNYVAALLNLLQTDSFHRYDVVSEVAFHEAQQRRKALSETIAFDVENGNAKGFGVLIVEGSSSPLCLVSSDPVVRSGFAELLERQKLSISWDLRRELGIIDEKTAEDAFFAVTKKQCGYVGGDAVVLHKLLVALRRDGRKVQFAALWFPEDEVGRAAKFVLQKRDDAERRVAEGGRMNEEARKQREAQRQAVQIDLQKHSGPRAMGLRDRVQNLIKETAEKSLDGTPRRATETEGSFQNFSNWLNRRFDDQWETTEVRSDVDDYGAVQWKDRNLEGIIVRTNISQKNAIQGVRRTQCFLFGFVDDVEFSMTRDLFDVECDKGQGIVAAWKARREFKSLWKAP